MDVSLISTLTCQRMNRQKVGAVSESPSSPRTLALCVVVTVLSRLFYSKDSPIMHRVEDFLQEKNMWHHPVLTVCPVVGVRDRKQVELLVENQGPNADAVQSDRTQHALTAPLIVG